MLIINTVTFVSAWEVFEGHEQTASDLSECLDVSWGDARHTLIEVHTLRDALKNMEGDGTDFTEIYARLDAIPEGVLIDLES